MPSWNDFNPFGSGTVNDLMSGQSSATRRDRRQQGDLLKNLQSAANGTTPSAAEGQMKLATERAQAQQYGLAASQPGLAPAQAMRMASTGAANAAQGIAGQTGIMRANEQDEARMRLMQMLQSMYSQDKAQAGVYQDLVMKGGQAAVQAAPALASDRRLKTDIGPGGDSARGLLDSLQAHVFRYEDPNGGPGRGEGTRLGVMAQDLERSAAGKAIVRETPHGKAIDVAQGLGAVMAALGELHGRTKRLEGRG